jgi:UDP-glucuronate 4-epimerase
VTKNEIANTHKIDNATLTPFLSNFIQPQINTDKTRIRKRDFSTARSISLLICVVVALSNWQLAIRNSKEYARLMRILVTGGAGFIGSHLVEKLLAAGHGVAILDDFNDFYDPQIKRENIAAIAKDVSIHHIDLRENSAVRNLFHQEKFDTIMHLAARAGVRPSIQHPQLYYDTNVNGTLHLLEAARVTGVERFIFASSSSVYGVSKTVPFSEDLHLTQTISPYAATKIAGEFLCSTYSHLYGLRVIALRYFTVYGPRQRPDLAIHQFTKRIHAGKPIDQFGDGTTRRDYTYIDDIVQGTMAALNYDGPMFDIFNLGESETIQLKDLIAAIETALGKKATINRLPEQPGDVPLTCADISKAQRLLGYKPITRFSDGLPRFVDWFLRVHRGK